MRGEGVEGYAVNPPSRLEGSDLQPFCLESYTQSNYTVITPSTDLEALA